MILKVVQLSCVLRKKVAMIEIDQESCRNLETALSREWLETNGIGGFSSSTITGLNTRRYHGLLTAATKPPVGRLVLLSKLEETLIIDGRRYELSTNQYPGAVHPQGFTFVSGTRHCPDRHEWFLVSELSIRGRAAARARLCRRSLQPMLLCF